MCLRFFKRIFCKCCIGHLPKQDWLAESKIKVLALFKQNKRLTTTEVAKLLGKSRSYAAKVLNHLEKQKKLKEVGKKGKTALYEKI